MKDTFSYIHPAVSFAYFAAVITLTMLYMHPVLLAVSLAASASYVCILKGARHFAKTLLYIVPFILLMALINALFNHQGVTPVYYLQNGNAITKEALAFGVLASVMFCAVILWFDCFNVIMTSDKLLFLFGRLSPSVSLLISMSLRFVPKFGRKIRSIDAARAQIGQGSAQGGFIRRVKNSMSVLSIALTWALESSVTAANSMKSRGYGAARRTSFSIYRFDARDAAALAMCALTVGITVACVVSGGIYARYYPSIIISGFGGASALGTAAFALLCFAPHLFDAKEALVWRHSVSAI